MSDLVHEFDITLTQDEGYRFIIQLDKPHYALLVADEPTPLGGDAGPNAGRFLAAAITNCLTASLLFCMQRRGNMPVRIDAKAHVTVTRNADKRLRIAKISVVIRPEIDVSAEALQKCLETFEDFCVVTQSVREGLEIEVKVDAVAPGT